MCTFTVWILKKWIEIKCEKKYCQQQGHQFVEQPTKKIVTTSSLNTFKNIPDKFWQKQKSSI